MIQEAQSLPQFTSSHDILGGHGRNQGHTSGSPGRVPKDRDERVVHICLDADGLGVPIPIEQGLDEAEPQRGKSRPRQRAVPRPLRRARKDEVLRPDPANEEATLGHAQWHVPVRVHEVED